MCKSIEYRREIGSGSRTYFVEPNVITEVRIMIQFHISTVGRTSSFHVSSKDVNDPMLNFFCDLDEVHIIAATGRALDLHGSITSTKSFARPSNSN